MQGKSPWHSTLLAACARGAQYLREKWWDALSATLASRLCTTALRLSRWRSKRHRRTKADKSAVTRRRTPQARPPLFSCTRLTPMSTRAFTRLIAQGGPGEDGMAPASKLSSSLQRNSHLASREHNGLQLFQHQLYLAQMLFWVGANAELDGLDEGRLELCTQNTRRGHLVLRISQNHQVRNDARVELLLDIKESPDLPHVHVARVGALVI
mmetsp:Transcript_96931/g.278454  ORF Transcript_96931/g.278454 Transcript_96931/m.278454 type:complete len:211 (-) Transcript_96931:611-1243(-)